MKILEFSLMQAFKELTRYLFCLLLLLIKLQMKQIETVTGDFICQGLVLLIIDGRNFYDQPINSNERQYDELRKVTLGKGDDYTTGCLLDYAYYKRDCKIIAVDLSKQKELDADPSAIQQIDPVGRVAAPSAIVTVLEESKQTVLEFFKGTAKTI